MKTNKQNILRILLIIIILIGICITLIKGLNWNLEYGSSQALQITLGKDFEVNDIKNIVKEVINDEVTVQKVEIFETSVLVKVKNISDEQLETILSKINEKYELELTQDDIGISQIPNYRGRDIVKPYIVPIIIWIALTLVYIAVRYRKTNILKTILEILVELVITIILLLSVYAIFRLPINSATMGIALAVMICYILLALRKINKLK